MLQQTTTPSRRANYRIAVLLDVWVCWNCNGREDISGVRDMSIGGLFLNTQLRRATGTAMKIDFLVQEGQIRPDAVVRHAVPDRGLGLKSTAITEQDCPRFAALMRRVRNQDPQYQDFVRYRQNATLSLVHLRCWVFVAARDGMNHQDFAKRLRAGLGFMFGNHPVYFVHVGGCRIVFKKRGITVG